MCIDVHKLSDFTDSCPRAIAFERRFFRIRRRGPVYFDVYIIILYRRTDARSDGNDTIIIYTRVVYVCVCVSSVYVCNSLTAVYIRTSTAIHT